MKEQANETGENFLCGRVLPTVIVVTTLAALGVYMTAYKIDLVREVRFVGHADEAAYAEMGRSLVKGRGFVRHVSTFFIPYNPNIERREDHWPPFMGMAIAPAFKIWGMDSWSAKLPAILFGSIGLPVAAALLGIAFSGKPLVGLVCGLLMMTNLRMFTESLKTLCDVPIAMLLAFFLAALIAARKYPWLHITAGIFAALAYYAKGSFIVLFPLYPLIALLACGWRALSNKWTYAGLDTAIILILPWLATNWAYYGNPLHSTQNFVSGYIGFGSWEKNFYHPYWGEDPPTTSDRWSKHGERYWEVTKRNAEAFTRWALFGTSAGEKEWYRFGRPAAWLHQKLAPDGSNVRKNRAEKDGYGAEWGPVSEWPDPLSAFSGVGTVFFWVILLIATPLIAAKAIVSDGISLFKSALMAKLPNQNMIWDDVDYRSAFPSSFTIGPALAILLVMLIHWAFVVFLWEIRSRFAFVFLPATAVFSTTAAACFLQSLPTMGHLVATNITSRSKGSEKSKKTPLWLKKLRPLLILSLCLLVYGAALNHADSLREYHQENVNMNHFPYSDRSIYPALGDWLYIHKPDAVIMARRPWQLRFHSPDSLYAVGLPYAPPEEIIGIGWYYGITHYLDDQHRPGMDKFLDPNNPHPAFERIEGAPGKLYRIKWEKLKPGEDFILFEGNID